MAWFYTDAGDTAGIGDAISRITAIASDTTRGVNDVNVLASYEYNGLGMMVRKNLPEPQVRLDHFGGTSGTYAGLDRFGRIIDQRWIDGSDDDVDRYQYAYDRNANRTAKANLLHSAFDEDYGYDGLNRLISVERDSTAHQAWDLDQLGNWMSFTTDASTQNRTHNSQNQITQIGTEDFSYDANGNLVRDRADRSFMYDAWNRLWIVLDEEALATMIYRYDALGRRITEYDIEEGPRELYYSAAWQVVEERQSGVVKVQQVWSPVYVDAMIARDTAIDSTAGALDTSFDTDGKVTTDMGGSGYGQAVATQSDGRMVVVGYTTIGLTTDIAVARYNSDGSLDTTFGSNGKVTTDVLGTGRNDAAFGAAIQDDGKIVVVGETIYYGVRFAVVRYNSDGSLDTSFGSGGTLTTDFGYGESAQAVRIQPDGKILVAGHTNYTAGFVVARFNSDGSLDTSFGSGGKLTTTFGGSGSASGYDLALDPSGKIVVVGRTNTGSGWDFAIARYNSDGSLDTSFGSDGQLTTDLGGMDWARSIAIQPDGKLVVAGFTTATGSTTFALVRYDDDGSLDTSFGSDGKLATASAGAGVAYKVLLQPDGKLLAVGTNSGDFAVARYNADGSLDTTFDGDGKLTTDFGGSDSAYGAALTPDGSKLVVAGSSDGDFAVARYELGPQRQYVQHDANYNVTAVTSDSGVVLERYIYDPYGAFTVLEANWSADPDNASDYGWVYLHQGGRYDSATGLYVPLPPTAGGSGLGGGGRLIHLTDAAGSSGIMTSSTLRGSHGIFAVPSKVAGEGTMMKVLRTGLTPGKTTHFVPVPQSATGLFQRPIPIGPYSAWKYAGGVHFAPPGSINMTSGAFTGSTSLIGPRVLIYGPDVLFYGGIGTAGGLYLYGAEE